MDEYKLLSKLGQPQSIFLYQPLMWNCVNVSTVIENTSILTEHNVVISKFKANILEENNNFPTIGRYKVKTAVLVVKVTVRISLCSDVLLSVCYI